MFAPRINPDFRTTWDGPILVIDDFLLNVDEFRESLMARGQFANHHRNKAVVDVGPAHDWRQILSARDFPEEFNQSIARLQGVENPTDRYGTNLFYSDMKIEARKSRSSHFPHTDYIVDHGGNLPIVFNLWLHDGGGGTGFYTFDNVYTSSAMSREHRYFAENYGVASRGDASLIPYQSYFAGDDTWKLWKVAEMKKNRAFVYCGDFWHRILIPEGEFKYPNARFSFLCFSTAPAPRFLEESGSLRFLQG